MSLAPSTLLHNRYRILSELGRGGMGAVYFGRDENLGVEVAIKENMFVSPESERQFKREATLLASLRHPSLPRVTDHFVIPQQGQYLVMDFVPGGDLKHRLAQAGASLPEAEVVGWAVEILDALQYLHSLEPPIIHRDIKPGNIKITPEGRAVLVDFGLAKIHDAKQQTTTGAKALTPGFAPPEQYGTGRTDSRTDLYSLAATLYSLLTNSLPADSLERAIGSAKLVPIRQLNPAVSEAVAQAVEHGLAVKPEERFATAADFKRSITGGSAGPGAAPLPTVKHDAAPTRVHHPAEEAAPTQAAGGRNRWLIPLGLIALLVLGGGGVFAYFSARGSSPVSATATAPAAEPTQTSAVSAPPTDTVAPPTASPTETLAPTAAPTAAPIDTARPQPTARGGGAHGQLAFVSERTGRPQLFLMNADGTNVVQLTDLPDGACQPAWSPDGARLLYVSPCSRKSDGYERATIYAMNADDLAAEANAFIIMLGGAYDPDWGPGGVLFTGLESNRALIYLADAGGAVVSTISRRLAYDNQPTWSPDGKYIAYRNTSNEGRPLLFWMYADGSFAGTNPDQITRVDSSVPAWSPKGDVVAYVAGTDIFVITWDAKGFNEVRLTDKGPNDDPDWSPDGKWIVFESWRDNSNHDIYVMTASGGQPTRLTDDPAREYHPAWRP